MNTSQLIQALGDAASATKPPQEYCLLWIDWWPMCMTKTEWSGWMQAIGSILALGIAIWIPWSERKHKKCEDSKKAMNDADITIRFNSEVLDTNESLLQVALTRFTNDTCEPRVLPQHESEVLESIRALRAVPFNQIQIIAAYDPDLAKLISDFSCNLDTLRGVLGRNEVGVLQKHSKTVKSKLEQLKETSNKIREKTLHH